MLCFSYLQFCCCFFCLFFFCFFFYIFFCFFFLYLLAILASLNLLRNCCCIMHFFLRLATFTLHATCPRCPHSPLPPTLSPLNGAAHFATLMPIWCTSLSATLPLMLPLPLPLLPPLLLAVVIPKNACRRWLPWFATAFPQLPPSLLPRFSRVE